jgi:hypothetical protein
VIAFIIPVGNDDARIDLDAQITAMPAIQPVTATVGTVIKYRSYRCAAGDSDKFALPSNCSAISIAISEQIIVVIGNAYPVISRARYLLLRSSFVRCGIGV